MSVSPAYRKALHALLTPRERRVFAALSTPARVQDFLDRLPINFEIAGDTHMSPRRVLQSRRAHCTEGAMLAAACFAYHGHTPWLLDLRAAATDFDHVIAPFQSHGLWGAVSKTNHPALRWRDPIYRSPRELAMSFAHEYYLRNGKKTLRSFSGLFRLTRFAPARWVTADDDLDWLIVALDDAPHTPVAPSQVLRRMRKVSPLERAAGELVEWARPLAANRAKAGKTRPGHQWLPRRAPPERG